jgi:hypothetical protein
MTSQAQRKLKKKKTKERDAKKRVLARREALRVPLREEKAEARRNKRQDKFIKEVASLDNNFQFFTEEQLANLDESTLTQLEENCKVLRGLEHEFEKEVEAKLQLNEELEDDGHFSLQEKLKAMSEKTITQQKNIADQQDVGTGGVADCKMAVAKAKSVKKKSDTAEIALVKANEDSSEIADSPEVSLSKVVEEIS